MKKFTYGYDTGSKCWIVGLENELGLIWYPVYFFGTLIEAKRKVNELEDVKKLKD